MPFWYRFQAATYRTERERERERLRERERERERERSSGCKNRYDEQDERRACSVCQMREKPERIAGLLY